MEQVIKLTIVAEVNVEKTHQNRVSNPIHHSRFQKLEKDLNDLFLKELNSPNSIFISISPNVTKRIAMFLSGMAFRPAAIGICGETACGKTTIVLDAISIIENFCKKIAPINKENGILTRINTDDYYYDRSQEVQRAGSFAEFAKNYDLDTPDAIELSLMKKHVQMLLNHQETFLPKYDMSGTAKRFENHTLAKPSPVVISEGLYTLVDEITDIFDFKIYVNIDKEVQKKRFYDRAEQRGLGSSADRIFENASQKALIHIHPCVKNADIILNGEISREKYKQFMHNLMDLVEVNYYNFTV